MSWFNIPSRNRMNSWWWRANSGFSSRNRLRVNRRELGMQQIGWWKRRRRKRSKKCSRKSNSGDAEEAREPTLDVMMTVRDRRWNWRGHILRVEEHRVIRRVLMNCVRPSPDSLFGDAPELDSRKEAEISKDRENWKSLRPSKRC